MENSFIIAAENVLKTAAINSVKSLLVTTVLVIVVTFALYVLMNRDESYTFGELVKNYAGFVKHLAVNHTKGFLMFVGIMIGVATLGFAADLFAGLHQLTTSAVENIFIL